MPAKLEPECMFGMRFCEVFRTCIDLLISPILVHYLPLWKVRQHRIQLLADLDDLLCVQYVVKQAKSFLRIMGWIAVW
jgi:hypothetical protein